MEEETIALSDVPVTKIDTDPCAHPIKVDIYEELPPVAKEGKEEDEAALGGEEFIKVERESIEIKDCSGPVEHGTSAIDRSLSNSNRELLEAQEKTKELEEELERLVVALKESESENVRRHAVAEEGKAELETRFIAAEQKNVELEEKLSLLALKNGDAEKELKEFSDKVSELSGTLVAVESEKNNLISLVKESNDKVAQLEASLSSSTLRISELEEEVKSAAVKCTEHENRANTTHQRSIELEDLIQMSHLKADGASKKASDLELLLETEKYRIQELEEQISALENERADAEANAQNLSYKVGDLTSQLEELQAKSSSLEIALESSKHMEIALNGFLDVNSESQREMLRCLVATREEKWKVEDESKSLIQKLAHIVEILKNELIVTQDDKKDWRALIEQHLKALEQTVANHSELEWMHVSATRNFEFKIIPEATTFTDKDSDAQSLLKRLKAFEDGTKEYESQLTEASRKFASLNEQVKMYREASAIAEKQKIELEESLSQLKQMESAFEELNAKSSNFENENRGLAQANLRLTEELAPYESKLNGLESKLSAAISGKDEASEQLYSSKKVLEETVEQLTAEGHTLKSQISVLEGENARAKEAFENELQALASQLEENLKEQEAHAAALKLEIESLKKEIAEKSKLETHIAELEEQVSQITILKERESGASLKVLEHEASLKQSQETIEEKSKQVGILELRVKELETKLQLVEKEKETSIAASSEIKSRDIGDIGFSVSTPTKSKKKSESSSIPQADTVQSGHASPGMTFKFVIGVAIVSIIIGVILGKKY